MKTFQYRYTDLETFTADMEALRSELADLAHSAVLFHVFAEQWCQDEMPKIRSLIREMIPEAKLAGTASFGNILEGRYSRDDVIITAMVFEKPDTKVEVFACPLDEDRVEDSIQGFLAQVKARPQARAVEAFIMADVAMVTRCCELLNALPDDIAFFGGKSRFDHSPQAPKFVITDEGEVVPSMAVFVVYEGEQLHFMTDMIVGWNPLGKAMQVTRAEGDILCELDGRPAQEVYYKYLNIQNDDNFFFNTLEFPILFYHNGSSEIRISHACLPDGSMVLGATIPENDHVRIAFGDSGEIMRSVLQGGKAFEAFRPDGILLFSCGCRHTFWGGETSNRETRPFESLAPTSGFYTAGELLRTGGVITEHNSTLVVAALREGDASEKPTMTFGMDASDISEDDSVITRLSTFIHAAIDELEETNSKLEKANQNLALLSITDGLTGLLNRRETERLIREAVDDQALAPNGLCLLMMDVDDFKRVNDSYGHQEGDRVLQSLSALLLEHTASLGELARVGRWGGEEFIILLKDMKLADARALAEQIRAAFENGRLDVSGSHTVSMGVTALSAGESADALISRADAAMYEAKRMGKNQVVSR